MRSNEMTSNLEADLLDPPAGWCRLLGYRCFRSMEKHYPLPYGATHMLRVRSAMVPLLAVLFGTSVARYRRR